MWLRVTLESELDQFSSDSLFAGAEVLLMGAEEDAADAECVTAVLESVAEFLREEGAANSADALAAHWYAAMDP